MNVRVIPAKVSDLDARPSSFIRGRIRGRKPHPPVERIGGRFLLMIEAGGRIICDNASFRRRVLRTEKTPNKRVWRLKIKHGETMKEFLSLSCPSCGGKLKQSEQPVCFACSFKVMEA